ncbi:hypothetical protein C8J56DRAFT_1162351 [Mycena floridula]|nr:hypothetical protein C8J56DRAFT_1162351 [Mycena floridula]
MDIAVPGQAYTILRIKRKRNEEPLDALVVEAGARRKKSRAGIDVFQFAQTVDDAAWKDEARQKAIQDEISRLSRNTAEAAPAVPIPPPVASSDPGRRYTVRQQESPADPSLDVASATRSDFKVLDVVPYTQPVKPDPAMEKINELLMDYLSVQEPPEAPVSDEEDFVWDIFYRRPGSMTTLPGRAIGTIADFPPTFMHDSDSDFDEEEDEADEDSNAEDNYKNDYPDEEDEEDSTDSHDEFHEHSDDSDDEYYHHGAQSDDEDWR